jgi:hypothetical protein
MFKKILKDAYVSKRIYSGKSRFLFLATVVLLISMFLLFFSPGVMLAIFGFIISPERTTDWSISTDVLYVYIPLYLMSIIYVFYGESSGGEPDADLAVFICYMVANLLLMLLTLMAMILIF